MAALLRPPIIREALDLHLADRTEDRRVYQAQLNLNLRIADNPPESFATLIPDFDQALRLTPTDADAFYNRGWAYARVGDNDRAIQDYDQAIRFKANLANAFQNRSLAYAHKGDYLRAIPDRGHYLWLRLGTLGSTIRLCILTVAIALAFRFGFKRFCANSFHKSASRQEIKH